MPKEVRRLGVSWPPLAGSITGLTPELEKDFRFGQKVVSMGGMYRLGGNLKGGTSTMWYPSSRQEFRAYKQWRKREGIPSRRSPRAFSALLDLFESHRISISTGQGDQIRGKAVGKALEEWGTLFQLMLEVLSALPASHLVRRELEGFQIGGWGPDAAKGSAYDRGWILLYDFILGGAQRTLLGLFLHELGHAQECAFGKRAREEMKEAFLVLVEDRHFLGVEFLLDPDTRRILQQFSFGEFIAETYMIYTSQGGRLRDFIEALPCEAREAYSIIYRAFVEAFEGREYP